MSLSKPGHSCIRGKLELNILNMHVALNVNDVHCRNSAFPNDVQIKGQLCTYQYISVKLGLVENQAIGYLNLKYFTKFHV